MNLRERSLAALAALTATAVATSQDARRESVSRAPFVFEAGEVELRELIERCGVYLQRNILVDDRELLTAPTAQRARPRRAAPQPPAAQDPGGPVVTLQMPVVTDRDGCEELLSSLLWKHGLVLVPLDEPKSVYEVLSMTGARQREIAVRAVQRTPEQVLARPTLRQFVTVVLQLEHTHATVANNALRPFFASNSPQGIASLRLGNVGNSTALMLSGPQDMVANALLLLKAADVPTPPEAQPELEGRIDTLTKQTRQLFDRIAALERKLDKR